MAYKYKMEGITMLFVDYIYHSENYNKDFSRKTRKFNLSINHTW